MWHSVRWQRPLYDVQQMKSCTNSRVYNRCKKVRTCGGMMFLGQGTKCLAWVGHRGQHRRGRTSPGYWCVEGCPCASQHFGSGYARSTQHIKDSSLLSTTGKYHMRKKHVQNARMAEDQHRNQIACSAMKTPPTTEEHGSSNNTEKGENLRSKTFDWKTSAGGSFATDDKTPLPLYLEVGDLAKENSRGRSKMLTMFDQGLWREHRSTTRYLRHMAGILQSTTFRALAEPMMSVSIVSSLVCWYESSLKDGTLPSDLPSLLLPPESFSLTSFALALLLVFRTNTSYDRWLEVNLTWWRMTDRARDILRQVVAVSSISSIPSAVAQWLVAYCIALKSELQAHGPCTLSHDLTDILQEDQLTRMMSSTRPSSFALSVLTEIINKGEMSDCQRQRLDENLTFLEDAAGSCLRILKVPIPVGYTRHTSRFMVIWLTALPLGVYGSCGWLTVPLCAVTAFLLLGIDEIGVQIEEPFALIPLDQICIDLERDLQVIIEDSSTAKSAAVLALTENQK